MRGPALAAMLALSAGASAAQPETAEERGLAIAQAHCARCHDIGHESAKEDGNEATSAHPQAPPFRALHKLYPVEHLAEALVEGILTGHADMPEFRFAPEEAEDLIAYLRSLEQ